MGNHIGILPNLDGPLIKRVVPDSRCVVGTTEPQLQQVVNEHADELMPSLFLLLRVLLGVGAAKPIVPLVGVRVQHSHERHFIQTGIQRRRQSGIKPTEVDFQFTCLGVAGNDDVVGPRGVVEVQLNLSHVVAAEQL